MAVYAVGDIQGCRSELEDLLAAVDFVQRRPELKLVGATNGGKQALSQASNLQPQVRETLARVAGIVSSQVDLILEVEGHTDSVGSEGSNQLLSERRAQAARDYLVSQGVSPDAIVFRGFGEGSPIASNDTARGRQSNRRVEIVVSGAAIGDLTQNR